MDFFFKKYSTFFWGLLAYSACSLYGANDESGQGIEENTNFVVEMVPPTHKLFKGGNNGEGSASIKVICPYTKSIHLKKNVKHLEGKWRGTLINMDALDFLEQKRLERGGESLYLLTPSLWLVNADEEYAPPMYLPIPHKGNLQVATSPILRIVMLPNFFEKDFVVPMEARTFREYIAELPPNYTAAFKNGSAAFSYWNGKGFIPIQPDAKEIAKFDNALYGRQFHLFVRGLEKVLTLQLLPSAKKRGHAPKSIQIKKPEEEGLKSLHEVQQQLSSTYKDAFPIPTWIHLFSNPEGTFPLPQTLPYDLGTNALTAYMGYGLRVKIFLFQEKPILLSFPEGLGVKENYKLLQGALAEINQNRQGNPILLKKLFVEQKEEKGASLYPSLAQSKWQEEPKVSTLLLFDQKTVKILQKEDALFSRPNKNKADKVELPLQIIAVSGQNCFDPHGDMELHWHDVENWQVKSPIGRLEYDYFIERGTLLEKILATRQGKYKNESKYPFHLLTHPDWPFLVHPTRLEQYAFFKVGKIDCALHYGPVLTVKSLHDEEILHIPIEGDASRWKGYLSAMPKKCKGAFFSIFKNGQLIPLDTARPKEVTTHVEEVLQPHQQLILYAYPKVTLCIDKQDPFVFSGSEVKGVKDLKEKIRRDPKLQKQYPRSAWISFLHKGRPIEGPFDYKETLHQRITLQYGLKVTLKLWAEAPLVFYLPEGLDVKNGNQKLKAKIAQLNKERQKNGQSLIPLALFIKEEKARNATFIPIGQLKEEPNEALLYSEKMASRLREEFQYFSSLRNSLDMQFLIQDHRKKNIFKGRKELLNLQKMKGKKMPHWGAQSPMGKLSFQYVMEEENLLKEVQKNISSLYKKEYASAFMVRNADSLFGPTLHSDKYIFANARKNIQRKLSAYPLLTLKVLPNGKEEHIEIKTLGMAPFKPTWKAYLAMLPKVYEGLDLLVAMDRVLQPLDKKLPIEKVLLKKQLILLTYPKVTLYIDKQNPFVFKGSEVKGVKDLKEKIGTDQQLQKQYPRSAWISFLHKGRPIEGPFDYSETLHQKLTLQYGLKVILKLWAEAPLVFYLAEGLDVKNGNQKLKAKIAQLNEKRQENGQPPIPLALFVKEEKARNAKFIPIGQLKKEPNEALLYSKEMVKVFTEESQYFSSLGNALNMQFLIQHHRKKKIFKGEKERLTLQIKKGKRMPLWETQSPMGKIQFEYVTEEKSLLKEVQKNISSLYKKEYASAFMVRSAASLFAPHFHGDRYIFANAQKNVECKLSAYPLLTLKVLPNGKEEHIEVKTLGMAPFKPTWEAYLAMLPKVYQGLDLLVAMDRVLQPLNKKLPIEKVLLKKQLILFAYPKVTIKRQIKMGEWATAALKLKRYDPATLPDEIMHYLCTTGDKNAPKYWQNLKNQGAQVYLQNKQGKPIFDPKELTTFDLSAPCLYQVGFKVNIYDQDETHTTHILPQAQLDKKGIQTLISLKKGCHYAFYYVPDGDDPIWEPIDLAQPITAQRLQKGKIHYREITNALDESDDWSDKKFPTLYDRNLKVVDFKKVQIFEPGQAEAESTVIYKEGTSAYYLYSKVTNYVDDFEDFVEFKNNKKVLDQNIPVLFYKKGEEYIYIHPKRPLPNGLPGRIERLKYDEALKKSMPKKRITVHALGSPYNWGEKCLYWLLWGASGIIRDHKEVILPFTFYGGLRDHPLLGDQQVAAQLLALSELPPSLKDQANPEVIIKEKGEEDGAFRPWTTATEQPHLQAYVKQWQEEEPGYRRKTIPLGNLAYVKNGSHLFFLPTKSQSEEKLTQKPLISLLMWIVIFSPLLIFLIKKYGPFLKKKLQMGRQPQVKKEKSQSEKDKPEKKKRKKEKKPKKKRKIRRQKIEKERQKGALY